MSKEHVVAPLWFGQFAEGYPHRAWHFVLLFVFACVSAPIHLLFCLRLPSGGSRYDIRYLRQMSWHLVMVNLTQSEKGTLYSGNHSIVKWPWAKSRIFCRDCVGLLLRICPAQHCCQCIYIRSRKLTFSRPCRTSLPNHSSHRIFVFHLSGLPTLLTTISLRQLSSPLSCPNSFFFTLLRLQPLLALHSNCPKWL